MMITHPPLTAKDRQYLDRCRKQAKRWGGDILLVKSEFLAKFPESEELCSPLVFPDSFSLWWEKKLIFVVEEHIKPASVPGVIHEMGHCFATRLSPEMSVEKNFLGFEYALARELHLVEWWKGTLDSYVYPLHEEVDFMEDETSDILGNYSEDVLRKIWKFELKRGHKFRNVSLGGRPIAVR